MMTVCLRKRRGAARLLRLAGAMAVMAAGGPASAAEFNFNPYGSGQYVYDSNVYRFSTVVAAFALPAPVTDTADRYRRYAVGLDTGYTWQQQKLHVTGEGRRFQYQDFKPLDRDESTFEAGFDGGILSNTTGLLNYRDERRLASFEDRRNTTPIMEHDRSGRGALRVAVTPDWHLETGVRGRNLLTPLPAANLIPPAPGSPPLTPPRAQARYASPNFAIHEAAASVGVQYGTENKERQETEAALLTGAMLEYQTISFSGVTPPPPPPPGSNPETFAGYRLLTLAATAKYTASGLSAFDAKLGATQYNPKQSTAHSKPELTFAFGYTRKFSVVTEASIQLFRKISTYSATADATTDTGVGVGAIWQPILDLALAANYSWSTSQFRGLSGIAPENSGRTDRVQNASLSLAYPLFRWFSLRAFGTFSDRRSNLAFDNFTDKIAGAELSFRWK